MAPDTGFGYASSLMNANVRDPAIQDVSGSTFDRLVLEAAGPVVVEFMSYGCGHCRTLEPVLEGVATSLGMTELFFRVNVAVDDELANRYAIAATPTLVFFREGREIGRVEGPHPAAASLSTAVTVPFRQ